MQLRSFISMYTAGNSRFLPTISHYWVYCLRIKVFSRWPQPECKNGLYSYLLIIICYNIVLGIRMVMQISWVVSLWPTQIRPIIVSFLFIVISCTQSSMRHAVIIWLFHKIFENFVFSSLPFFICFYMCFVHTSIDFETI